MKKGREAVVQGQFPGGFVKWIPTRNDAYHQPIGHLKADPEEVDFKMDFSGQDSIHGKKACGPHCQCGNKEFDPCC